jgi:hypothetical protein
MTEIVVYNAPFAIVKLVAFASCTFLGDRILLSSVCGCLEIVDIKQSPELEINLEKVFSSKVFTSSICDVRVTGGFIIMTSGISVKIFDFSALTFLTETQLGPWPITNIDVFAAQDILLVKSLHGEIQFLSIPSLSSFPVPSEFQSIDALSIAVDPTGLLVAIAEIIASEKELHSMSGSSCTNRLQVIWKVSPFLPKNWILSIPTSATVLDEILKENKFPHQLSLVFRLSIECLDSSSLLSYSENAMKDTPDSMFLYRVCEELRLSDKCYRISSHAILEDGTMQCNSEESLNVNAEPERLIEKKIESNTSVKKRRKYVGFHETFLDISFNIAPREALRVAGKLHIFRALYYCKYKVCEFKFLLFSNGFSCYRRINKCCFILEKFTFERYGHSQPETNRCVLYQ